MSACVTAHTTYRIEVWGKCQTYLRSSDNKPASPHNHQACTCPECAKPGKKVWYKCVMTEQWMREDEIIKTREMGGS